MGSAGQRERPGRGGGSGKSPGSAICFTVCLEAGYLDSLSLSFLSAKWALLFLAHGIVMGGMRSGSDSHTAG